MVEGDFRERYLLNKRDGYIAGWGGKVGLGLHQVLSTEDMGALGNIVIVVSAC